MAKLFCALGVLGMSMVVSTADASCATDLLKESAYSLRQVLTCVIESETARESEAAKSSIPTGAVVAFATECPKTGWVEYKEGWGRVLMGAVTKEQLAEIPGAFLRDARGVDLQERPMGKPGGEQQHLLTIDEMPSHTHQLYRSSGEAGDGNFPKRQYMGDDERQVVGPTLPSGGGQAHNIIPPYVALSFCKKT